VIYYWDTSAIVKVYHREEGSDRAMQMFSEVLSGEKKGAVAYVCLMETISAFTRRRKELKGNYEAIVARILQDMRDNLSIVALEEEIMESAMKLIINHGLKTLDSIHLATALFLKKHTSEDVAMISADRELLTAAAKEGLDTVNPSE